MYNHDGGAIILQFSEGSIEQYNNHKLYLKEMSKRNLLPKNVSRFGLKRISSSFGSFENLIIKTGSSGDILEEYNALKNNREEASKIIENLSGSISADSSVMDFDPSGLTNDPSGFYEIVGDMEDDDYYELEEEIN
jgi:hypothetical protein